MAKINSLQGQVVDKKNRGIPGKIVEIKCREGIACSEQTDSEGYFKRNNIDDKYIDKSANEYKVFVDETEQQRYEPRPPLQNADAKYWGKDPNGNDVWVFPIKIWIERF